MRKLFAAIAVTLCVLITSTLHAEEVEDSQKLKPGEIVVAQGKVAYSLPMSFDYDKDGTQNSIAMGAHLFIKKTQEGKYEGFLQRGLFDIDKNISIGWYLAWGLLQQAPRVRDISVRNVEQNGTTIKFDIENTRFTVSDGGQGYMRDKIIADKHIKKPNVVKLYDGDIEVIPPK